jgi:integrase/recombinase XerC
MDVSLGDFRGVVGAYGLEDAPAALARLFGEGVRPLRMEEAVFAAMLTGWHRQQLNRGNRPRTIHSSQRTVERLRDHAEAWPWEWEVEHVEQFIADLVAVGRRAPTLRRYQSQLRVFLGFLADGRYPWQVVCLHEFGRAPRQLFDERNLIIHIDDWEGDPRRRALARDELQAFFDYCDAQVAGRRASRRKGTLAALRDAAMFKVCYAWGLRRTELIGLDLVDLTPNPRVPVFGAYGMVRVRYGKASKGGNVRPRNVLTVWQWAARVLEQYVSEIRPQFGFDEHPALWLTERGGRVAGRSVDDRFAEIREEIGLPRTLVPHCLRHSYITHLHEQGFDPLFVKEQAGHRHMSTTALYTSVSSDFKDRALAEAIATQIEQASA